MKFSKPDYSSVPNRRGGLNNYPEVFNYSKIGSRPPPSIRHSGIPELQLQHVSDNTKIIILYISYVQATAGRSFGLHSTLIAHYTNS